MEQIWTVAALWIGMALSWGTDLKREGPHGKAWPLLLSVDSPHWGCIPKTTPAETRAHLGGMGVS